ncbi:transaldolase family protein [Planctomycetota bacterium]
MIDNETLPQVTHDLARSNFRDTLGQAYVDYREKPVWQALRGLGTELWLDTGDRDAAERLWCTEFSALTTNNTLLNNEIQKGIYDELIPRTADVLYTEVPELDKKQLVMEIGFVLNATHALTLVDSFDAQVSVEVHTDLAHDLERTVAYGRRFYAICPERFIIKVPFTPSGLLATRMLRKEGIPVNMTLGFSARQNVLAALLADPTYVNVFMGRLGAYVADNGLGDGRNVGEKATLATQRALCDLRNEERSDTRLIGASMRDSTQVGNLAGLDVYTMPLKVAEHYEQSSPIQPHSHIQDDPDVTLTAGTKAREGFNALWEVSEDFQETVERLICGNIDVMTAESISTYFAHTGYRDLFPAWSLEDVAAVEIEGKIPIRGRWQRRLAARDIGLDALMNLSALRAFAKDQHALDQRIISLLEENR